MDSVKKCSECKEVKGISLFYSNKAKPSKVYSRCKVCERKHIKTYKSIDIPFNEANLLDEVWSYVIVDNKVYPYVISNYGRVKICRTGKIAKPSLDQRGYPQIVLSGKHGRLSRRIHRLVACTFIHNKNNKREVNHIDGNKLNNSVNNLEWVSSKENVIHAIKSGLR
jgi:hypothetical protein